MVCLVSDTDGRMKDCSTGRYEPPLLLVHCPRVLHLAAYIRAIRSSFRLQIDRKPWCLDLPVFEELP